MLPPSALHPLRHILLLYIVIFASSSLYTAPTFCRYLLSLSLLDIFTIYCYHILPLLTAAIWFAPVSSYTVTIYCHHPLSPSLSIFLAFSAPYIVTIYCRHLLSLYIIVMFCRHNICISSQSTPDLSSMLNLFASPASYNTFYFAIYLINLLRIYFSFTTP
jgi:hypothetical protein